MRDGKWKKEKIWNGTIEIGANGDEMNGRQKER